MIKATVQEVRAAFSAFSRIFEETKLDAKSSWRVSRLIGQLKPPVKDFDRAQLKQFKDAGGVVNGNGVSMPPYPVRDEDEKRADFEQRFSTYRQRMNTASEAVEILIDNEVEINYDPIPLSMLPKTRKNDKGEEECIEYRATDFADCGPFIIDDTA